MWVLGVILLEFAAFIILIWAFCFLDEPLASWEHKAWKKIRRNTRRALKAVFDALESFEERINWRTRKIRREICARILAKDGVSVQPLPATERELDDIFREVMRLLEK